MNDPKKIEKVTRILEKEYVFSYIYERSYRKIPIAAIMKQNDILFAVTVILIILVTVVS
jgi:hypothetical protein